MHGPEVFIGKASKGAVVGVLLRILGNAAYESLRLALRVKFGENKIKLFHLLYISFLFYDFFLLMNFN